MRPLNDSVFIRFKILKEKIDNLYNDALLVLQMEQQMLFLAQSVAIRHRIMCDMLLALKKDGGSSSGVQYDHEPSDSPSKT